MDTTTRPSISRRAAVSRPGPESSTTMSAQVASFRTAGSSMYPVIDRLEALRNRNKAPSPTTGPLVADQPRSGSPPAGSAFTTSAPASASSFVQYPPAIPLDKSRTLIPPPER